MLLASSDPRAKMALDYFALPYRAALPGCWQQRCRGSMDSYSRLASERTRLPFVRRWRNRLNGWGLELDLDAILGASPASREPQSRIACHVIRPTRSL